MIKFTFSKQQFLRQSTCVGIRHLSCVWKWTCISPQQRGLSFLNSYRRCHNLSQQRNNRGVIPAWIALLVSLDTNKTVTSGMWHRLPLHRAGGGWGACAIFWPTDAFQKRSSWQLSFHQSFNVTLSIFSGTVLQVGWRGKNIVKDIFSPVPPPLCPSFSESGPGGGVDLLGHLILWKGHSKASWKTRRVGRIDLKAFFYLSRWTCVSWSSSRPMVRRRDNNLLALQISFSLALSLQPLLSLAFFCHTSHLHKSL